MLKRILCAIVVLIILLAAYTEPAQDVQPSTELGRDYDYGVYELNFSIKRLSGWLFGSWDFIYTLNGEEIKSGHQVLLSLEILMFYSVQVDVIEWGNPENSYTVTFPVAICEVGYGKTEITVTGSNGKTETFQVTCDVTQVGKL